MCQLGPDTVSVCLSCCKDLGSARDGVVSAAGGKLERVVSFKLRACSRTRPNQTRASTWYGVELWASKMRRPHSTSGQLHLLAVLLPHFLPFRLSVCLALSRVGTQFLPPNLPVLPQSSHYDSIGHLNSIRPAASRLIVPLWCPNLKIRSSPYPWSPAQHHDSC